ncbi:hypothetical protein INT43_005484 [Umbelopsis isabellina]|uniref:Uncharacterized protein n=1 Tax=Mortierella isabellina TaxID=91625 RepID=A0A8H7PM62_MORIS|nr:hypothetical protein INT43_005484 [Umbelopsis isabellina]
MTRDDNTSQRKVPANRWSNIFQVFKTNTAKPTNGYRDSEASMTFRRRPSATSEDSTLSSSASDEEFNKSLKKFHELYRNAVDDLAYAKESFGSIYYTNDRDAALEATRKFIDALVSWREQREDNTQTERIYHAMKYQIREIQRQCEALPIVARYSSDN